MRNPIRPEHGDYKSGRNGQVLLFSGRGPWNDQTMRIGSREMSHYIAELDHSEPWAQISCVFGESLMPPSTFDAFVKHTNIRKQIGLSELAIVIRDTDIRLTIEAQLSQAYAQCEIKHQFYADIEEAIQAIHKKYDCDIGDVQQFFADYNFATE